MPAPVDRRRFLGLELKPAALVAASGLLVAAGEPVVEAALLAA